MRDFALAIFFINLSLLLNQALKNENRKKKRFKKLISRLLKCTPVIENLSHFRKTKFTKSRSRDQSEKLQKLQKITKNV